MKIVKKNLVVLILLVLFGSDYLQAQCTCTESPGIGNQLLLCENFESYTNGSNFPFNNSRWGFWPGTSTFGKIQTAPSSNSKALLVQHNGSTGPDLLLKLGNRTTGSYRISWQMYIPKGKSANYNFQQNETGGFWGFQVNFDGNGIGTVTRLRKTASRFPYLIGAWNNIMHIVNLNTGQMELWINDEFVDSWQFGYGNTQTLFYSNANILAAINFYAPANAAFYVDNICMEQAGPPIFFNVFPTCLKNGQSLFGEESTYSLYTQKEYSNESCRNICSFAGLNVKNSLKYDDQSRVPASKIDGSSILPNQILNLPCLQYLFPTYTRKQLRGQIYPFTATSSNLYIDLQFQVGSKDSVRIALIECSGSLYPPCQLGQSTDGLTYIFNVQPGKTYNIIVIAVETVEFTIDISTVDVLKICKFSDEDEKTTCICKDATTTLSQPEALTNVRTSDNSATNQVFPEIYKKDYSGGEKAFRITLDRPSLVNFTLSSANQGYIMFLAGSDCADNLLALNWTPDNGGTATIPKALEAGVYHLIVDQLRANTTSRFNLTYTVSALDPVSRASNSACPITPNNAHQVSIRSSPLLLNTDVLGINDRIYLVNPRNTNNREANAINWSGQQINFTLYEDANSDNLNCGYVEGDLIEFVIIRPNNNIYSVRPIFQPEDGADITAGSRFKKGGKSLITGFVSILSESHLGVTSIPTLSANAGTFDLQINSNQNWRIQRINANKPSWLEYSPASGDSIDDVSFKVFRNQSTQARTDTVLVINDQGFYKSIVITQPGCTGPSINAGVDQSICAGQKDTLTASGVGIITWENPGLVSNPRLITPTLNATQTFTAYATINGCTASDQVTVNVLPKPNANAGADTSICAGFKAVLSARGGGAYTWSNGSTATKLEVNPTTTTTYTLTVTSQGCTATDQVVVVVNRASANAGTDRSICRGDSTTLQASGGGTYLWSNGKTSPSIKVNPTSDQVYQVTVTDNNCPATATVKVTVNQLPKANAGADTSICAGQSARLIASGGSTYKWSNNANISSITVMPVSTETFMVTVTSQNGCEASDQLTVTVRPLPTANAGPDQPICSGSEAVLSASGGGTYTWSDGSTTTPLKVSPTTTTTYTLTVTSQGCTATDQVVVVVNRTSASAGTDRSIICRGDSTTLQVSGGGTYLWSNGKTSQSIKVSPTSDQVYQVTVSNNNCPATASVKVTVNPLPLANAGLPQTICLGEPATLSASGGGTYLWSTTASTQQITVNPTQSTDYTVTVTQNGCSNTAQVRVTVNSATANAGPDQSICAGQSVMLTASGGGTYQWSTNADTASITLIPNQTQTYTVTVTQNACTATDQVTVTVRPLPIVNAGIDQSICIGERALLTASGVGTYKWSTTASTSSITVVPLSTQTFSVTATQEGCTASDEVVVVVKPLPSANAGPDLNICAGQNAVLNASGGTLYKWSTSATTSSISLVPTNTQTFSVTVTQEGCESTDEVLVTVKTLPTANAGPDQSICAGQSTVLNATGGSAYKWSGNLTKASINISPIGTQLFTVTVTQNDCEATDEVLVTVKPLPSANAGPDQSICAGQNVALTASGGSTYKWSTTATTSSISITPLATQIFKVTVTQDACEATDEVQVEVKALPAANAGADISICAGQNAVLNASGGSSYRWNTNAAVASITVSPTQTQKYTVTVSQNACEATDEVVVTVKALPNANAGPDQSICAGQSATLNAAGGGTYKWSTNASTTSITVNPLSAQIFTVSVTQDGCTASDEVLVTVKPLPSANAGPDQSICAGQSVVLTASGGSTYKWSTTATTSSIALTPLATQVFKVTVTQDACEATDEVQVEVKALPAANAGADISICAGQNAVLNASGGSSYRWNTNAALASITVSPTQTQKYTVTVSQNACEATDEILVTVKALPNANAGLDQSICIGQSATLIATGGGSYKWNTNSSTSSITVNPSATQIFTVSVTQDGCTASDEVLVTIKPLPSANAGPDQSICAGQNAVLTASGGSGYKWNNNASSSSISVTPVNTATFTVTVTQNGCEATDQLTVTVRPLPIANAGSDQSICAGQSAVLTASGGSGYKWNNNASSSSISVTPVNTATFTVTVTQNGCEATDQLTVTVRPLPIANAGPDLSICAKQSALLSATGGNVYKWSNNATTASITISPAATQVFTVTVTQNECQSVDEVRVMIRPLPNANAGPDQSICAGQSVVLNATGGGTYKWNNSATTSNISVSPMVTQSFTLTVTQNDCEATDQVIITVNANPSIKKDSSQFKAGPNSFIAVSVTGGKAPYQYQWFRNDTLTSTQEDLIGLKTGIYKLTIQDANGCSAGYGPELFIITSTRDVTGLLDLKIYPNPTQGQFRIEGRFKKQETVQVYLLDVNGKYIWKSDAKNADHFLYTPNLSNLAKGIYIIQLDVSGDLVHRKLVVH